jgi:hypothetical protein
VILTDKTQTLLELRAALESEWAVLRLRHARHSPTLIDVIPLPPPQILVLHLPICLIRRLREDQRQTQQQALFVDPATVLRHFPDGTEYRLCVALEKAGGPMTESRSWTTAVKEKARLTPPFYPDLQERRYPRFLKASLVLSYLMTLFMIHNR